MNQRRIHVVKFGGSLLDPSGLPDLIERFEHWRHRELQGPTLLVVGGGVSADVVRDFDAAFHLGEERSHWLALRAMQFNAHLFAAVIPNTAIADGLEACERIWRSGQLAIADALPWLERDEARGIAVPHRWSFTSDSVAAHLATQLNASRLTLLKSTLPPPETTRQMATEIGIVDASFAEASASLPQIEMVNLRSSQPTSLHLR